MFRLEDLIGRRLGRYEIIDVLGRGGMAAVYRARDTVLRREVALKILYPQYTGDTALVERFQREAVLAAGLDHPNILPIYDVGEADGLVYIAMRLLDGRSFADLLRLRSALPIGELLPLIDQIAAALDYAHARQIVHRDIKPANILIEAAPGASPRAVLTDFGIAKSLDPAATGLTVTGVLIGTPEYMAPEQIRGSHKVDARADIYALGVLIYRALTGRRPFEGGTQEVLLGHLQGTIADPSSLDPSLPPAIDTVIRRALAREPGQRYASAGELARALRAAAGYEPPTPPPARRRPSDGRAVVPSVAVNQIARHGAPTTVQPTARGDAAPPYARQAHARPADPAASGMPPARQVPPAYYPARPERRGSNAALAMIGLLLALAIGGGMLYAFGILAGGSGGGGVILPTTAAPAPTDAPATSAPATEIPTAGAAPSETAAPAPTEAPATSVPTAAASPTPRPTAAPTSTTRPTSTPEPTNTPEPTSTPEPTNTPTNTPAPLAGGFGMLYDRDQTVRERLGQPTEAEIGGARQITEQEFEAGSMFYFMPLERIYVLLDLDSGEWQGFDRDEVIEMPIPTPSDPPACNEPISGGFARIWGSQRDIQRQLGCSIAPVSDLIEGAYQAFERGVMLYSSDGLGRGKSIYVLYEDGTFERFDDPNQ